MKANVSFGIKPACFLLESVDRPDIVEQLHAPEGVCPRELLQLRRRDIALGYFFRDDAPKFPSNLRISAGQITQHDDAWHSGAKLIVLDRPGADLIHGRGARTDRFQEWMFDADLRKRLNVLLELVNKFLACHASFLLH